MLHHNLCRIWWLRRRVLSNKMATSHVFYFRSEWLLRFQCCSSMLSSIFFNSLLKCFHFFYLNIWLTFRWEMFVIVSLGLCLSLKSFLRDIHNQTNHWWGWGWVDSYSAGLWNSAPVDAFSHVVTAPHLFYNLTLRDVRTYLRLGPAWSKCSSLYL